MTDQDKLKNLKNLVSKKATENDCRDGLLELAKFFSASIDLIYEVAEHTMQTGRCDILLVGKPAELQIASLDIYDKPLYVYECKSPKKNLFEFDENCKRYVPTSDLIQAETQLINYTYTMRETLIFYQNKYGVRNIETGGLIIGTENSLFKNTSHQFTNEADEKSAKRMAFQSRNDLIYKKAGIRLFTWDVVIQKIEQYII